MSARFVEDLKRICSALLVAAGFASVAPAHAVVIIGKWDPAFGSAFPDLGWRGEAKFFVPDACLAESGWVFNFESCSNFGMKILSAEVEFYKLSDPTNAAFQETLSFGDPSPLVASMKIEDGMLAGLYGTFDYFEPSTLPLAGGPYTEFVLFFEGDIARMGFISDPPEGHKRKGFSDPNPSEGGPPFLTFQVVPEPTSLTLLLLALASVSLALRASRPR
ncbi:MAG TPA: PEP-CTERM sorting domain-containing protein [Burkholderiaceae bacterium]|nr:PEP-CTERM sorting domain-containing protein [Burkholderiaceae bacterium]